MDLVTTRICRYCSREKTWIYSGKKLKDGTKIYIDQNQHRWAGRRCPDCEKSRVQTSLRWDKFERDLIEQKLLTEGYHILQSTPPLLVEKDGKKLRVAIRHAAINDEKLILEPKNEDTDLHILVFASVRLCSSQNIAQIESKAIIPSS